MEDLPRPNLVILGAQKSGTTSLYSYVNRHPDIFMSSPTKEPGYFLSEERAKIFWRRKGQPIESRDDLLVRHMLKGYSGQRWLGEASTYYTIGERSRVFDVPKRMSMENPELRFIYIMRDPLQRLISNFWHCRENQMYTGNLDSFLFSRHGRPALLTSHYHYQLEAYKAHFRRDQFCLIRFEDLANRPDDVMRQIWSFIGVSDLANPGDYAHLNATQKLSDALVELSPENFKALQSTLKLDLDRLRDEWNFDTAIWEASLETQLAPIRNLHKSPLTNQPAGNLPHPPYADFAPRAFWGPSVGKKSLFDIEELWRPKFNMDRSTPISSYGSCFAQHVGQALVDQGFNWLNCEAPPSTCSNALAREYGYLQFSSRTGNIYTPSLFRQWVHWALGLSEAPDEVWENEGRFFDPFRPTIEPDGFSTTEELLKARAQTIKSFKSSLARAECLIFTLGLTERWLNRTSLYEYPICPGTARGRFDPDKHAFSPLDAGQAQDQLVNALQLVHELNPAIKVILTVSPVPLTATATDQHVLVANHYSKSALRTVAGELANTFSWVDYFPSYEIITATPFAGIFYEPNRRSVTKAGVQFVMSHFFSAIGIPVERKEPGDTIKDDQHRMAPKIEEYCDDALLEAFGPKI